MGNQPLSESKQPEGVKNLGILIREKRKAEGLTLEQVANQSGVSIATLSRLESQVAITPDTRTLTALSDWLGVPIEQLLATKAPQESLPDIVETHLRANRDLNPGDAQLLARMFRSAYEAYTSKPSGRNTGGTVNESDK